VPKAMDGALGSLGWWGTSRPWQGNWMILKVHSNPSHSMTILRTSPAHFSNSWIRSHENHRQNHIHRRNVSHRAGPAQRQMGKWDRAPSRHVMDSAHENTRCGKKDPLPPKKVCLGTPFEGTCCTLKPFLGRGVVQIFSYV